MNKKTVKIILVVAAIVAAAIIVFSVPYLFDKRTKYGIELYLDSQNMILSATQTVDYFNATGDVLDEIKFNLYPNAFREGAKIKPYYDNDFENVYPDGADYGGIIVSEAASGKNKLQYSVNGKDMNILTVELDKPLKPRTSKKISLIYTVKIPKTNLRFGYSDGLINLTNFFPSVCVYKDGNFIECPYYPTGDPFFSEASDFDVKLVTDKSYAAAHSGNLKSERRENGGKIFEFEGKKIRDFALCLSENFKITTKKIKNVTIKYFSFDDNADKKLKTAVDAVEFFGETYSKYPYKTYCIAESFLPAGGMEYPNFAIVNKDLRDADKETVIVHETAHQWWYGIVGSDNLNHAWMDEGLAEFSTELFFLKNGKELTAAEYYHGSYSGAKRFDDIIKEIKPGNITMDKNICDFFSEYEYVAAAYNRGHLMFKELYVMLNEKNFKKAIGHYIKNNKFRIAGKDELIESFNKYSDGDIRIVFSEWINFARKY